MKKSIMLKKNYEFKYLLSKGKFYYGKYIHMYIKETNFDFNKFGIAISKKYGKAVKRNYVKRLIRENYKNIEDKIKIGVSILVVVNKDINIQDINYKKIEENFYNIFNKAGLMVN